jgi:hypothetical protein
MEGQDIEEVNRSINLQTTFKQPLTQISADKSRIKADISSEEADLLVKGFAKKFTNILSAFIRS